MSERAYRVCILANEIVVSLPGAYYCITYYKSQNSAQLLAKHFLDADDPLIPVSVSEFLDRSARIATEKAKELGWISETSSRRM